MLPEDTVSRPYWSCLLELSLLFAAKHASFLPDFMLTLFKTTLWSVYNECLWNCYSLSHVRFFATPWTVARLAPLSIEFSRQEYWSGLPFPSPGDIPNSGIEPRSPALQTDTLASEPPGKILYKSGNVCWVSDRLKIRTEGNVCLFFLYCI